MKERPRDELTVVGVDDFRRLAMRVGSRCAVGWPTELGLFQRNGSGCMLRFLDAGTTGAVLFRTEVQFHKEYFLVRRPLFVSERVLVLHLQASTNSRSSILPHITKNKLFLTR